MTIRILTFTTLYPNEAQLRHGIFLEQRLRHLSANGEVKSCVVAPVPWVPFDVPALGRYARFAKIPLTDERHGISIWHPRYLVVPKIGMTIAPYLLAASVKPLIRKIIHKGYDFDIFDAYYFYPDGVAAAILGQIFGKPVVISALGTDINVIPKYWLPRQKILWAARQASAITAVAEQLKNVMVEVGMSDADISVIRHGVDLDLFCLMDRETVRAELGLEMKTLLSVGHLERHKGHHIVIQALVQLPEFELLIVGDGRERNLLMSLAESLGVSNRVRFVGTILQEDLVNYYCAADALVLASSREGIANVLLEAMACGTPVVATKAGGTSEVVDNREAGVLTDDRSPEALARAIKKLFLHYPERSATRRCAEQFTWEKTSEAHTSIFHRILADR